MHEYDNSNGIPYGHTHCHVKRSWIVFHHSHPDLEHLIGEQQLGRHPQTASWHPRWSGWLDSDFFVCIHLQLQQMISFQLQESYQEMKYLSHSLHQCFVLSKVRTTKAWPCCSFCLSRFLQLFPSSIFDFGKALKCE